MDLHASIANQISKEEKQEEKLLGFEREQPLHGELHFLASCQTKQEPQERSASGTLPSAVFL